MKNLMRYRNLLIVAGVYLCLEWILSGRMPVTSTILIGLGIGIGHVIRRIYR